MQANENKRKQNSFHLFFGIGTFQRVTADSNKKNFPSVTLCLERHTGSNSAPDESRRISRLGNQ
jgi:hypothetical protein